jgi:tRNA A-37 threonylcarbamoyl transferase component Bud32
VQTTQVLDGRYELGPVLGQGGMARVHRAHDQQLRRPVAVKVLAPPFDRDRVFVERFRREARAAAGLGHPNIVAVFDTGSDDGTHYIVTELVEGETLAERIRREGPLRADEAVAIGVDVARALAAAHERGVIHRDVKPANVMLTREGAVKVVDFGIAHAAGSDTLTGRGVVLGSTAYLSPEQASGDRVDARSDVYAFGCVLYEMLTGQVPFRADTPVATMYRHVNEDPPPPSSVRPVPPALEAIVMRCLAKDTRKRFASAEDLEGALRWAPLDGATDTEPLVPVGDGDADTRPVAPMDGRTDEMRPVAPVDGRTDEMRPVARSRRRARMPWYRRPTMRWLAVAGVLALLGLAALALASTTDELRPRQAAREAGRTVSAQVPESTPPSVAAAWTGLMDEIASGAASGGIDEELSKKLAERAVKILEAYGSGDEEELEKALSELEAELAKGVEEEKISAEAADGLELAMLQLLQAFQDEGALVEVPSQSPSPEPTVVEEGNEDEGKGNERHGPPGHANDDKGKGEGEG